ncbi:MAG: ATP-dependent helicase [Candidatus Vogelbacteria bacterium]|nr:ATP-dependent helicase [Candidatus Vogelbacteria bacterium]
MRTENSEQQFRSFYERLNARQRDAVDTIEGPVMVVAGPGTGKTQILTLRIANILRLTDTPPDAILALTFTNAGVFAMRERLLSIVGTVAHRVRIHTFHSFCNETIERYPEYFPRIIGGRHASEPVRHKIIEKILDGHPFTVIRPAGDPQYYVRGIASALSELKRELVSPERLSEILDERKRLLAEDPNACHEKGRYAGQLTGAHRDSLRQLEKTRELLAAYCAYEATLAEEHLYDFDDMIGEVAEALQSNTEFRLIAQEQHQYILADEHQDANDSQNRILDLLAQFYESPNLFVVGDTKQAIYRFQGASVENFRRFTERYPSARVITLEENYRSHQTILDAAHDLISENHLIAKSPHAIVPIRVIANASPDHEYAFLAGHIAGRISAGAKPCEIAVMYRNNADAAGIARSLEQRGVATVVESTQDLFADPAIRLLRLLLQYAVSFGDDVLLAEVLYAPFLRIEPTRAHELVREAREQRVRLHDVVQKNEPDLFRQFARWKEHAYTRPVLDAFAEIFAESGFRDFALGNDRARELLDSAESLFTIVRGVAAYSPRSTLADALQLLDTAESYRLLGKEYEGDISQRVRLMTAHRAKGREFDFVYIAHATERKWSGSGGGKKFILPIYNGRSENVEQLDDERRLFYVALTRARKDVAISYSETREDGSPELPCEFLEAVRERCVISAGTPAPIDRLLPVSRQGPSLGEREYIADLFRRRGLSATSLNNYLECPWKYFFMSLVRIPDAKTPVMLYGTAVHGALKDFFDALAVEPARDPGSQMLMASFARRLEIQPMVESDFCAYMDKGSNALRGYWETYESTWHTPALTEYRVGGYELVNGITLTGSLDKIELLSGGAVIVVDYKTKKPESRNAIEGKTKGSSGNMKRQLVFYKLLLEGYAGDKFRMEAGEIDFIEPNDSGKYKKERFLISNGEVDELRETISRVGDEIVNASFFDSNCGDEKCRFCALGEAMKMSGVKK